jgi:hypothetical protein
MRLFSYLVNDDDDDDNKMEKKTRKKKCRAFAMLDRSHHSA